MPRILVVEDDPRYIEAAGAYFSSQDNIQVSYATDYDSSMELLSMGSLPYVPKQDGAIIDCFFPKKTGSGDTSLGIEAAKIMGGPKVRALAKVQGILGKEGSKMIEKDTRADQCRDIQHYRALERAMEESEANQPLGILVAGVAEERGIPFVLATSTFHHDELTQPIYSFADKKGWTLVDCKKGREDEKATPEFWERAFAELQRRM